MKRIFCFCNKCPIRKGFCQKLIFLIHQCNECRPFLIITVQKRTNWFCIIYSTTGNSTLKNIFWKYIQKWSVFIILVYPKHLLMAIFFYSKPKNTFFLKKSQQDHFQEFLKFILQQVSQTFMYVNFSRICGHC